MRLGTTLLFHQTKGVTPTPATDTLARHARNLATLLARMEAEMSECADGARPDLVVGALRSTPTRKIPSTKRMKPPR